jgi:hypothetical protein
MSRPRLRVLMLRYFRCFSSCGPVFWRETVADESLQFGDPTRGFQPVGEVIEFRLLAGRADGLAQSMGSLMTPPFFLLVGQTTTNQLLGAVPLQVQKRGQCQLRPADDALEVPEPVLMKAERRFQFLEKQFSVPIIIPPKITLLSS